MNKPTLTERFPIRHTYNVEQLPPVVASAVGEPFVVAGGCNCAACVEHRIRFVLRAPADQPDEVPVAIRLPRRVYEYWAEAYAGSAEEEIRGMAISVYEDAVAQEASERGSMR